MLSKATRRRVQAIRDSPDTYANSLGVFDAALGDSRPSSFFVQCPHCSSVRDCAGAWLFRPNKHIAVFCASCRRHSSGRQWRCACTLPWLHCPQHRTFGFACRPVARRDVPSKRALAGSDVQPHWVSAAPYRKCRKLCISRPNSEGPGERRGLGIKQGIGHDSDCLQTIHPPSYCS